uniref:Reverse transcriptase domain-containing protein n=1 Tax=Tanacetum cinerariifolium TaxID=118510 RepID=A0A6L2MUG3_TANCI|nr:reverse transcriptase domain-containing protein [Tanacetum cinerariifolium]
MNLLNGSCHHCIYGDGKPIACNKCEGMLRGGFCLPCNLKAKNSFIFDQNAYSFNDTSNISNHLPQPQYENHLCNLCGNNSHDGYDCQQQFPLVYEQEPSYNQNYDDNYYPHESPSFPCCDNYLQIINKELIECNRPTFSNDNEDHSVQHKEYPENSSNEIAASNSNQEKEGPPQNFDIRQLIREECCVEVSEEKKQNIENTIMEMVEICRQKSFFEVKNVVEQPTEPKTRIVKSLQNFRVIRYEHLSTTPEIELDEVTESSAKNLYRSQVNASDDESLFEEDVPVEESKVYSNSLFDNDGINSDELESHVESNFVESLSNHDALFDSSQKIDYLEEFFGELAHINPEITKSDFDFEEEICLIENLMYDNSFSRSSEEHNAEEERIKREHAEYFSRMEMSFTINPRPLPTVNANTIVESIPSSLIPVQDNDSQREEIDIVTSTDELLPLGVENDDDSEGEIDAVEELRVDNSISNSANELSDNEESNFNNPSVPLPPPEPPDAEFDFKPDSIGDEILVVMYDNDELECLDPRNEFENDNYSSFMFVIYSKMFLFSPLRVRIPSLTLVSLFRASGGTFVKRRPEECYDLIENMTAHHNDWDTSAQQSRGYPGRNKTHGPWSARIPMWQLFKGLEHFHFLELTPTCMTLELADRSVSKPIGIAKDVSVKVSVFHFPTDFVVIDFEPDPRVSLILKRCFLKTDRALIDVHKGKLTLRIKNEAITYNLDQTLRDSVNYNQMMANKIDVIDLACEEYSQEVLGFSNVTTSGNPTPYDDLIVSTTSPTLTPFGDSDFLLFEEADAFLGLEDDPNSSKINPFYYDPKGDILLLETILNSEPLPPPPQS